MVEYAIARRVGINSRKIETRNLDAAEASGCSPSAIYDEMIVEVSADQAGTVTQALTAAMQAGMAQIFPGAPLDGVVEAHVGQTWAEK